jgi:hypothetical protein
VDARRLVAPQAELRTALGIRTVLCSPSLRHLLLPAEGARLALLTPLFGIGWRAAMRHPSSGRQPSARPRVGPCQAPPADLWPAVPLTRSSRKRVEDDDEDEVRTAEKG